MMKLEVSVGIFGGEPELTRVAKATSTPRNGSRPNPTTNPILRSKANHSHSPIPKNVLIHGANAPASSVSEISHKL